jgi:hypothetical protein
MIPRGCRWWRSYVMQSGFDDEEDDEVICPLGMASCVTEWRLTAPQHWSIKDY